MSSTVADQETAEAATSGPVVDRLGKQIALGALAVFSAMMGGALMNKDPLGGLALITLAMVIFCSTVCLQSSN